MCTKYEVKVYCELKCYKYSKKMGEASGAYKQVSASKSKQSHIVLYISL